MFLGIDPTLARAFATIEDGWGGRDAASGPLELRAAIDAALIDDFQSVPRSPGVVKSTFRVLTDDGHLLDVHRYARSSISEGADIDAAVLYAHGGGMIAGSTALYDPVLRFYALATGVPFFSVDYRLAPEATGDRPARDFLDAYGWMIRNAIQLGIDSSRIGFMGDSGGGGVAASAAILARDRGFRPTSTILICPMLDARNTTPDPGLEPAASWTSADNAVAWRARIGEEDLTPLVSPADNIDFGGLAPTYIEVGSLDIFRDECLRYAHSLVQGGVDVEFHLLPGAPHGYDWFAFESDYTERWLPGRIRAIQSIRQSPAVPDVLVSTTESTLTSDQRTMTRSVDDSIEFELRR
ncbi:alpha/beta hydrolase fold domain-containing protein [Brevibacterium sp.]|uniref:alpha/beta hydrolase fold domain-containing protein n=1 Tax=Brevibacterium sp. TaxID=1701 RepID=UPI0028109DF8|nr:alpha/beta hydrolase fold domain-containing protein [Brevibacterium sp.]